jgi:DNA-3-methyladenine glycosylase
VFYDRPTLVVARELLGMRLVRREGNQRLAGIILETEAYIGEQDLACHAKSGLTPRTRVMYGPPGRAYVYFTYGTHWMLNAVTEPEGSPSAVLIRSIFPVEGLEQMVARRPVPARAKIDPGQFPVKGWTDGPAKLCQVLGITGRLNGHDLTDPQGELFVEYGVPIPDEDVTVGPAGGDWFCARAVAELAVAVCGEDG